jgi:hypothetical protein
MKNLLNNINNSKKIISNIFTESKFFKKKKEKFIKNQLKDENVVIKNLIQNYRNTKIKKKKKNVNEKFSSGAIQNFNKIWI